MRHLDTVKLKSETPMTLSNDTKLFAGITFLSIPTIEYGGTFLLSLLSGGHPDMALTEFQRAMFRAGHAHAGVLVMLSLLAQLFLDHVRLKRPWVLFERVSFVAAALLISGGFFGAAAGEGATTPGPLIALLWLGVALLTVALTGLGVGLLRARA